MSNDWIGNKNSIFKTLGASNHVKEERQADDYYATDPKAAELLLEQESFHQIIWECACGEGHLAKIFEQYGHEVIATDLVYRGYGLTKQFDFLQDIDVDFGGDIITNPPYKHALAFVQRALEIVKVGQKVAMFLKLQFLEGKARKEFFQHRPPKTVYVSSSRLMCAKNGRFNHAMSSAVAYAWFVWQKGFSGTASIRWIN